MMMLCECTQAEHGSTTQTSMHCVVDVPTFDGTEVWMVIWAVALAASRKALARYWSCMMIGVVVNRRYYCIGS
jgi:hypothetical protein